MEHRSVHTDGAPRAYGKSSQAVVAGDFVFCSGLIPLDPTTRVLVTDDLAAQTDRVLDNMAAILGAAGSGLAQVVRIAMYFTDLADFAEVGAAYDLRFTDPAPARTIVQVAALARGARIAMDCTALRR